LEKEEDLRSWLRLIHAEGVGPATLGPFLQRGLSPEALLSEPPPALSERARNALRSSDPEKVESSLAWLGEEGCHLVPYTSSHYPERLKCLPDAPLALFVRGDPGLLASPQIAIVGSRNPTRGGIQTTREFAAHFAGNGLTVTSGLALGIDGAAHEGALKAGGPTLAVMATGLDRIYPARHRELAHAIAENGALVSEFPPGTAPKPGHFPRRNRIISGLSLGVLVVEAALQSGSLITARLAAEQGREVFAIPGSIHNPLARGCHRLIRQGAKLVETAADVLEELAPALRSWIHEETEVAAEAPASVAQEDPDYQNLLNAMGFDPVSIDMLVERTGLPAETLSSMLLLLELRGEVSLQPGGRYLRHQQAAGPSPVDRPQESPS